MRIAIFAATGACALLAACGGPQTSQANNSQANISNDASPDTANASAVTNKMVMLSGPVSGQDAVRIMHERHEGMETIGKTTKAIKRELDSSSPNMAAISAGAAQIADLSRKASNWFPAGTGPDVGKTGAKPDIWQPASKSGSIQLDFVNKLGSFQHAAQAFNQAAMSGDVNAIKGKFGEMGQTCKACHDKYRSEMHHDH